MYRDAAPLNGYFDAIHKAHADFFSRCFGLQQAADIIVIC